MTEQQFIAAVSDSTGVHPAKLLRLALDDLAKVEADPKYRVRMEDWHQPEGDRCAVCLAGSVIAKTFDYLPTHRLSTGLMPAFDSMIALNEFRGGFVRNGYVVLSRDMPSALTGTAPITEYADNPAQFRADMEALIKLIETHDPIIEPEDIALAAKAAGADSV